MNAAAAPDLIYTAREFLTIPMPTNPSNPTFAFGRNWQRYLTRAQSPEHLTQARAALAGLLETDRLDGRTWLDIGCGSGVHSLAAFHMGAKSLASFDVDSDSVACCRALWERAGKPAHWNVGEGSILDERFVSALPHADIVYSWGVLHHTGAMWKAIERAASLVNPGGLFIIAIYNRVGGRRSGSAMWLRIKRLYVKSPRPVQRLMGWAYTAWHLLKIMAYGTNPVRYIRDYRSRRGMDWSTDLIDWLGGYPYEYAGADEVFAFCHDKLGLELIRLMTVNHTGNNQFVFRRPPA